MIIRDINNTQKIETLYAFLSKDDNGNDGIIAAEFLGKVVPLVFSNFEIIEQTKPYAQEVARKSGKQIFLVKFNNKEVIEEVR